MPDGLTLTVEEVRIIAEAYYDGDPDKLDQAGEIIYELEKAPRPLRDRG